MNENNANAELDGLIQCMEVLCTAARKMIGGPLRIQFFADRPEELCSATGWLFLFRVLNLGEAAAACAKAKQSEAVGLIARSLFELGIISKTLAKNSQNAQDFKEWSTKRLRDEFDKLLPCLKDPALAEGFHIEALIPVPEKWPKTLFDMAHDLDMDKEYRLNYSLLCLEAHNRWHVMSGYMKECPDGLELHQFPDAERGALLLSQALIYWVMATEALLPLCGIRGTQDFIAATKEVHRWGKSCLTLPKPRSQTP